MQLTEFQVVISLKKEKLLCLHYVAGAHSYVFDLSIEKKQAIAKHSPQYIHKTNAKKAILCYYVKGIKQNVNHQLYS